MHGEVGSQWHLRGCYVDATERVTMQEPKNGLKKGTCSRSLADECGRYREGKAFDWEARSMWPTVLRSFMRRQFFVRI